MKNRLSSRLRLTLSGVTLLTLLLMCVLVFAGMYFQTTADNREQLRQQAAWAVCIDPLKNEYYYAGGAFQKSPSRAVTVIFYFDFV